MVKSPAELRVALKRQWENASKREARLLGTTGAWPILLSIGRPSARMLKNDLDALKRHIEAWRAVNVGEVITESIRYRQAADPISIPTVWKLSKPSEWIDAIGDKTVRKEFESLGRIVAGVDRTFHSLLVRKRTLWINRSEDEVIPAAALAMILEPGCIGGRSLRTVTYPGIDTKFFERNAALITALLDVRYEGEVSKLGLETFLNAYRDDDHWLLIFDLDGGLLPFQKIRVRSSELRERPLPGSRLIVIENEACQHHLPHVPGTIAVLGAGFDLNWTDAHWLRSKSVAYWGDLDTWGLSFLSKTRASIPHVESLMMTANVFETYLGSAVREPVPASSQIPTELTKDEAELYHALLNSEHGRLEQEFLPIDYVQKCIKLWVQRSTTESPSS